MLALPLSAVLIGSMALGALAGGDRFEPFLGAWHLAVQPNANSAQGETVATEEPWLEIDLEGASEKEFLGALGKMRGLRRVDERLEPLDGAGQLLLALEPSQVGRDSASTGKNKPIPGRLKCQSCGVPTADQ